MLLSHFWRLLPVAALVSLSPAALAQGSLVSQQVRGAQRVCIFETSIRAPGSTGRRSVIVGADEPCPRTYSPPDASSTGIPTMATLKSQARGRAGVQCEYTYLGRTYRKVIDAGRSCPLTPNFF